MPPDSTLIDQARPPGTPARPRVRDPLREYVAGREQLAWAVKYYQTLPHFIDDVTRDLGDDLYERMLLDPQVSSCIHHIKTAALASGLHFTPAVDDQDPAYAQAGEIRDFCQRALEGLGETLYPALYDLLDALALGNRVAEIVLKREGGQLTLRALKVKPRRVTAFVLDPWQNLVGLLAIIPGEAPFLTQGTILGDLTNVPNLLPRERFLILTFRQRDGDPRGTSLLRAAYNAWWVKQQTWPEALKYLAQFANPSLKGTVAPDAADTQTYNADGTAATDSTGAPVWVRPQDAMLTALQEFRNSGIVVLPHGADVGLLEVRGDGSVHRATIDTCNREISKAILGQTLATEEGQHQARAASEIHQDTLGLVIGWAKKLLEGGLTFVCRRLVLLNYGAAALPLTPVVALSATEKQDFPSTATAVAALHTSGYFTPSQLPEVDALLNLPVRSPEEVEAAVAAQEAGRQAQQQALAGAPPSGDQSPGGDAVGDQGAADATKPDTAPASEGTG